MLTTAAQILRDPVEASDAAQDACLQACRNLSQFEGRSDIVTWLHRIAVNAAPARLCKRQRLREEGIDEHLPEYDRCGVLLGDQNWREVPPESLLAHAETRQIVCKAIDQLPDSNRIALILRDIEGLDAAEAPQEPIITNSHSEAENRSRRITAERARASDERNQFTL